MSWSAADERRVNRDPHTGEFRGRGGLSNGQSAFARRVVGALVQPSAEIWAWNQESGTLQRDFERRDRLVEERMRQLLRPSEFRAWYSQRIRQQNAKMRARMDFEDRERERRRHRTYRAKFPGGYSDRDKEQIRTVRRDKNPVRVRVRRPVLTERPYRTLTPTRFQTKRFGVFIDG